MGELKVFSSHLVQSSWNETHHLVLVSGTICHFQQNCGCNKDNSIHHFGSEVLHAGRTAHDLHVKMQVTSGECRVGIDTYPSNHNVFIVLTQGFS